MTTKLTKANWKVPIGKSYKGLIYHDFDRTPHMVGGGTTRYGKTNLIKVILTSLITQNPDNINIYLIDLKAGVEFYKYRSLRQVKYVATNPIETYTMLHQVMKQLEHDKQTFRKNNWSNILETPIPTRTFVIIDEAGDLVPESFMDKEEKEMHKECQWMLAHIARIGGAFGFRELFFSQYTTADVLPRQIKQNADAKIAFRMQNDYASEVVLGEGNIQAAHLDNIPGRAIFKTGADLYEVQVPLITDKQMNKLLKGEYENHDNGKTDDNTADIIEIRDID